MHGRHDDVPGGAERADERSPEESGRTGDQHAHREASPIDARGLSSRIRASVRDTLRRHALLRRAVVTGTLASVLSTIAISIGSERATGAPAAGTNATSHWLWGERAKRRFRFSLRYTAVGYAVHHACSIFWAAVFERWQGPRDAVSPARTLGRAAAISTLAFVVDYTVTPRRLRPGFEKHLSPAGMLATYAAFAAGLAAASLWRSLRR